MVKNRTISKEMLGLMAGKFRMLSDATRLAILHSLMTGGEMNVSQIVAATEQSVANVSKHLKQLANSHLLTRRKEGSHVFYLLDDPVVKKICELVCDSLQYEIEAQLKKSLRLLDQRRQRK